MGTLPEDGNKSLKEKQNKRIKNTNKIILAIIQINTHKQVYKDISRIEKLKKLSEGMCSLLRLMCK